MDVRGWPLDRIMQLPDNCFGRKWPIYFGALVPESGYLYYISEIALPERCVLWELFYKSTAFDELTFMDHLTYLSIALGDKLPATDAEFNALETFIPETDTIVGGCHVLVKDMYLSPRKVIFASGRRIVIRVSSPNATHGQWTLGLVFSSLPSEVLDCLLSQKASYR